METYWILAQQFCWTGDDWIDRRVWAPSITLADNTNSSNPFILIQPKHFSHLVQSIADYSRETQSYWINWWVTIGSHRYPMDHFDAFHDLV